MLVRSTGQAINITESGSNENGDYIKFDDGTMICTKIIDVSNVEISNNDNALKYAIINSSNFPLTFKTLGSLNAFGSGGPSTFFVANASAAELSKTGKFVLYATSSKTLPSGSFISVLAVGKWK